jgi:hypothetical protein
MLRRFTHLPAARRRLFATALPLLTFVRVMLALMPFRLVSRALARARVPAACASGAIPDVAWAIETAALGSRAANTCLAEALAADVLLRSAGVAGRLRFAVGRDAAGGFSAHAWLELPGGARIGARPPDDVALSPLVSAS